MISGCISNCIDWKKKADKINRESQLLFSNQREEFDELAQLIDSLIIVEANSVNSKSYIGYTIERENYSDGKVNRQNEHLSRLLSGIKYKELIIEYKVPGDSLPIVILYPGNLDDLNTDENCPIFNAELFYKPNVKSYEVDSPNFIFFKLSNNWFIRSSVATL
ncbi:hypothetical protein [Flavihumibacter petaseus]|uniref:Uncharacterized protein n=1 Tax=Flavihumibacter petaseus NBRC 106054 TaxID=1220578 RepID=A0A0E9N0V5_9BACT|nr:hypothetical protein [Flavihumibacter petaseus]GAO43281.1 hypothetical protein FPE01S_02_03860 [Flavihumibacter petaseus NBRC 106054]